MTACCESSEPSLERSDRTPDVAEDGVSATVENWRKHGWRVSTHFAAALSLLRVDASLAARYDSILEPLSLTRSRHETLALLFFSRRGQLPMGKIGERLMVHPTSVTSAIDTLERLGFAQRVPHPTDRRATLAQITPAGRRAIRRSNTEISADGFGLGSLSVVHCERLASILEPVRQCAGDLGDAQQPRPDPLLAAAQNWRDHGWDIGAHFIAAFTVYRAAELIRLSNEGALRHDGLTRSRYEALALLFFSRDGELPMTKLSERRGVQPTSVTHTIDILEGLGLVQRAASPTDRRTTMARITDNGRLAIRESNDLMTAADFGLRALSTAEAEQVVEILRGVDATSGSA